MEIERLMSELKIINFSAIIISPVLLSRFALRCFFSEAEALLRESMTKLRSTTKEFAKARVKIV